MKRNITLTFAIATFLIACSKQAAPPDPDVGHDAGDATSSADVQPDTAGEDVAPDTPDAAGDACAHLPDCAPHERRLSTCLCVHRLDRRCYDVSDCRPDESCREFEFGNVCWFEPPPLRSCPGADGCDSNDGVLHAAAVRKVVTPLGFETPKPAGLDAAGVIFQTDPHKRLDEATWNDCGLDGLCPGDDDYPGPDEGEGDGVPQGIWIAGFTTGRAAQYCPDELIGCDDVECCVSKFAHDDIELNLAVFRQGETTVVFAAVDTVGLFHTDIARIEAAVKQRVDVDLLVMAATHNHQGPDTSGQWGPGKPAPTTTGVSPSFMQRIEEQTVAAVEEAVAALQPATIEAAVVDAGTDGLAIADSRAPYIFDDNLPVVRVRGTDGTPIATLFSFANHAEVRWSANVHLTSDYFGYARRYVRDGLPATTHVVSGEEVPALDGHGGVAVAFAGAVGGLINPGRGGAADRAGNRFDDELRSSWAATDALGQQVAARVLAAPLQPAGDTLSFATTQMLVPVENRQLELAAVALNLIERDLYNASWHAGRFQPDGHGYVLTQVAVVRLGDIDFFTAPGEAFPELLVGGYPGRPTAQNPVLGEVGGEALCGVDGLPTPGGTSPCIVRADQANPPNWANAPMPPYAYDRVDSQLPFFIGLGIDFLGYMVPPYDFQLNADGSHYEETNGIGSTIVPQWEEALQACIDAL